MISFFFYIYCKSISLIGFHASFKEKEKKNNLILMPNISLINITLNIYLKWTPLGLSL